LGCTRSRFVLLVYPYIVNADADDDDDVKVEVGKVGARLSILVSSYLETLYNDHKEALLMICISGSPLRLYLCKDFIS